MKAVLMKNGLIINAFSVLSMQFEENRCKIVTDSVEWKFVELQGDFIIKIIQDKYIIEANGECNIINGNSSISSEGFVQCPNYNKQYCVVNERTCRSTINCNIKINRVSGKYKWLDTCYTCIHKKISNNTAYRRRNSIDQYRTYRLVCTNEKRNENNLVDHKTDEPKRRYRVPNFMTEFRKCSCYVNSGETTKKM